MSITQNTSVSKDKRGCGAASLVFANYNSCYLGRNTVSPMAVAQSALAPEYCEANQM